MLLVQEFGELHRPRLIRDLPIGRIDDRPADHRPLTADGDVLGALRLRILDAVGDDVARLGPLALDVGLTVGPCGPASSSDPPSADFSDRSSRAAAGSSAAAAPCAAMRAAVIDMIVPASTDAITAPTDRLAICASSERAPDVSIEEPDAFIVAPAA